MSDTPALYRGRFAPSPTGPLHFGSLIAAVGSYLEARSRGGQWLVRIEDLDPPREVPGASGQILQTLERYGFEWDGPVCYQSTRHEAYLAALEQLRRAGRVYRCTCSRKQISQTAQRLGLAAGVYPGTCRNRHVAPHQKHAVRLLTEGERITFVDALQGECHQDIEQEVGDFVLHRADGLFAYQLAVVVDDAEQGITHIVRGSDLLDSTPRQILLQRLLGYPTPAYLHLPVAVNREGQKLSKQTFAPALAQDNPVPSLWQALHFLGQNPPLALRRAALQELWQWALGHWKRASLPRRLAIPYPERETNDETAS